MRTIITLIAISFSLVSLTGCNEPATEEIVKKKQEPAPAVRFEEIDYGKDRVYKNPKF